MSVTVRLEGLSSSASSRDIRDYFSGLEIPLGGVTVIGGERSEAFVHFITWEDARRAIQQSGRPLKDSTVYVSLSCREDMELALRNTEILAKTLMSGNNGTHEEKNRDESDASLRTQLYLRIKVRDSDATLKNIQRYFYRLPIIDVLYLKDERLVRSGDAIVKFASNADATVGLNRYWDSKSIRVSWSTEEEWLRYGGLEDENLRSRHGRKRSRSRSPRRRSRSPRRRSRSPRRRSRSPRKRSRSPRRRSRSLRKRSRSPRRHSRSSGRRSRSPRKRSRSQRRYSQSSSRHSRSPQSQSDGHSSISEAFHVRVLNLSYSVDKSDLKKLFYNYVSDNNITFVRDQHGNRTRECFVMFTSDEQRTKVLQFDKCTFKGRCLYISSISKSSMQKLLAERKAMYSLDYSNGQYFYLRSFPSDVSKSDVQEFFSGFSLNEEEIYLLCDKKGVSLGEVLVKFSTKEEIAKADKLNRKKFKGKEIPLKRIPEEKLKSILREYSVIAGPTDPYDCVTQEDDTNEDNCLTQEDGSSENKGGNKTDLCDTQDASTADNDFFQIDHECVTQADDVDDSSDDDSDTNADIKHEDTSFIQADDAPNEESDTNADIKHEDTSFIQADNAPNKESDTNADIKQEDKCVIQADDAPNDDSDINVDIKQEDKCVIQADNATNESDTHADIKQEVMQVDDESDTHADIKQEVMQVDDESDTHADIKQEVMQVEDAPNEEPDTHADNKPEDKCVIQTDDAPNVVSDTHAGVKHEGKCVIQADSAPNDDCVSKANCTHGSETGNDEAM